MGFLDNFTKNQSTNLHPGWRELTSITELEEAIAYSHQKPVAIFKHSTRCGISLGAKNRLEQDWDIPIDTGRFYYLDLLNHRDISNEIARRSRVVHQSPQVIIFKNGEAIFDISHHAINGSVVRDNFA